MKILKKLALAATCLTLSFAVSADDASGIKIPRGAGLDDAKVYHEAYAKRGGDCPATVKENAKHRITQLDSYIKGLAAVIEESGDTDAFAEYFQGVVDTAEQCGDGLGWIPHRAFKAVGDQLGLAAKVTRSATTGESCLAVPFTQSDLHNWYSEALLAREVWKDVASHCKPK